MTTVLADNPLSSPAQVIARLDAIDRDLAGLQHKLEEAAFSFYRAKRAYEQAFAEAYVQAEGTNQRERESRALLALAKAPPYKSLIVTEAAYESVKAVARVLDTRASIGQSILRAQRDAA